MVWTPDSALIREVSLIQSVLYKEAPLQLLWLSAPSVHGLYTLYVQSLSHVAFVERSCTVLAG